MGCLKLVFPALIFIFPGPGKVKLQHDPAGPAGGKFQWMSMFKIFFWAT
jgi:hypothetical protein